LKTKRRKYTLKKILLTVVKYGILCLGSAFMVIPFFWLFSASLMTPQELIADTPRWLPETPQWQNYIEVPKRIPILRFYWNSFLTAGLGTLGVLLTSSLAGFAFGKIRFPGRKLLFRLVLATMMFPVFIFLIPVYYLMRSFGWLDNHLSLIMPFIVSSYGIFLIRQFVMTVPDELIDSARIDGAGYMRIYASVILPILKPALATLAILTFIGQWNSFLWPLIVTTNAQHLMTMPVGISRLTLAFSTSETQHLIMTALVFQVVPMVAVFMYFQKNYVKGFVLSGFGNI
jgi:multiple sugar transport system permease protein